MEQSDELLLNGSELEEPEIQLEGDNQPSTIQIFFVSSSPIPSPLPPLPFIFPTTGEQSVQSDEHEPNHPSDDAMLVVWDLRLPGSFPPASHTSILLAWWCSKACYGTFSAAAYVKLAQPIAIGGNFPRGDPQSDNMEGLPVWNPSDPEMMQE